jgi:hypothetical protein
MSIRCIDTEANIKYLAKASHGPGAALAEITDGRERRAKHRGGLLHQGGILCHIGA